MKSVCQVFFFVIVLFFGQFKKMKNVWLSTSFSRRWETSDWPADHPITTGGFARILTVNPLLLPGLI